MHGSTGGGLETGAQVLPHRASPRPYMRSADFNAGRMSAGSVRVGVTVCRVALRGGSPGAAAVGGRVGAGASGPQRGQGADRGERRDEVVGPGPGLGEPEVSSSGSVGEAGGTCRIRYRSALARSSSTRGVGPGVAARQQGRPRSMRPASRRRREHPHPGAALSLFEHADDGEPRENGDVVEITGMLDLTRWPSGMRVLIRR